ncbi:MAG: hypothetical protein MJK13_09795 [Pseudomonadales bacterium]|nr:hypothetical protein [Pseudomonadales bacterium]
MNSNLMFKAGLRNNFIIAEPLRSCSCASVPQKACKAAHILALMRANIFYSTVIVSQTAWAHEASRSKATVVQNYRKLLIEFSFYLPLWFVVLPMIKKSRDISGVSILPNGVLTGSVIINE